MKDKDLIILTKIYNHANSIIEYTKGCSTLDDFENNSMLKEACVFNLMQIGELAKIDVSDETKDAIKDIPWNEIYGMRNRIVHGYDSLVMNVIWSTICKDIPKLRNKLNEYLDKAKK